MSVFEPREFLYTLPWLHGKLELDEEANLYYLIGNMRAGNYHQYYNIWSRQNQDGTTRLIHAPKPELRQVQQQINRKILRKFTSHPCSYGFMGGSCKQAAQKQKGFGSVLALDLRTAFSQVSHPNVFNALYGKQAPQLSFYAARFVADICTVGNIIRSTPSHFAPWRSLGGVLPQGAPTSPRLFDLCLREFDDNLSKWAGRLELKYTRYADNLFFASTEAEFPALARSTVLTQVHKYYLYHKVRQVSHGDLCRMLGLNAYPDKITNSRDYKRGFRKALYHLEFVLENGLEYAKAWEVVSGYAGFAVMETLPEKLLENFEALRTRVHILDWGW